MEFDTIIYRYWVKTFFEYPEKNSCETMSFFNSPPYISVEEINNEKIIRIFPNPTNGRLYFKNIDMHNSALKIYDIRGTSYDIKFYRNSNSIELGDLPDGMYFIKITTSEVISIKKVILNK